MEPIEVVDGIGQFRPLGRCSLAEVVDLVNDAIAYCRDRRIEKLLVDGRGLVGVPIPSLVDRFLMVEEWAQKAQSMVVVVLVVHPEYIHPEKFGVRVAADFGLTCDVYASETDALEWLASGLGPNLTTA
jgi:hypothetical protein